MIRDVNPESRIRILIFFTHPGSRAQKGTGSRIRIRNTDSHDRFLQKNDQVSIPDEELIIFEAPAPVLVTHAVHLAVLGPGYQQDPADKCRIVVLMDPGRRIIMNGRRRTTQMGAQNEGS